MGRIHLDSEFANARRRISCLKRAVLLLVGCLAEGRLTALIALVLVCPMSAVSAEGVPTHCKPEERVFFSCPFKNGKTVSLCASPGLTNTTGILQYRYGKPGEVPELVYPDFGPNVSGSGDPKLWYFWSSWLWIPLEHGRETRIETNNHWSTAYVPPGQHMGVYLDFSPINEDSDIGFTIQAEAGKEASFQGGMLRVTRGVGYGSPIVEYRCLKGKTTEDLFSLKDLFRK